MASWGGYSFIINLLPIHCLACVVTGRLTPKLYIAYAPFVVLGTLTAGAELFPCSGRLFLSCWLTFSVCLGMKRLDFLPDLSGITLDKSQGACTHARAPTSIHCILAMKELTFI